MCIRDRSWYGDEKDESQISFSEHPKRRCVLFGCSGDRRGEHRQVWDRLIAGFVMYVNMPLINGFREKKY